MAKSSDRTQRLQELREHCFKMLFCQDFYPDGADGEDRIIHQVEVDDKTRAYLEDRTEKIIACIPELDMAINEVAEGWKTRRMGKVELTILRLALYEIKKDENISEKVAINEAVELAKKFGGDDSPAFVNGILAKLV